MSREPIHEWFELSYSNYLVIPRSVLQSMPVEWQDRFVAALEEMGKAFGYLDWPVYDVRALARRPEFLYTEDCPDCHDNGEWCETCDGEGEVEADRYETPEEVGVRPDPIPHYWRGRTRLKRADNE